MGKYDNIINLPCPEPKGRQRMPISERAAIFAPFAALTGHSAAINETARLTESKIELDEDTQRVLDEKQAFLSDIIKEQPEITVTHFVPDECKEGGAYIQFTGNLKRIDDYEMQLIFADGTKISTADIINIESEHFKGIFDI